MPPLTIFLETFPHDFIRFNNRLTLCASANNPASISTTFRPPRCLKRHHDDLHRKHERRTFPGIKASIRFTKDSDCPFCFFEPVYQTVVFVCRRPFSKFHSFFSRFFQYRTLIIQAAFGSRLGEEIHHPAASLRYV